MRARPFNEPPPNGLVVDNSQQFPVIRMGWPMPLGVLFVALGFFVLIIQLASSPPTHPNPKQASLGFTLVLCSVMGSIGVLNLVNATCFRLGNNGVQVCSQPIPWYSDTFVPIENISTFGVESYRAAKNRRAWRIFYCDRLGGSHTLCADITRQAWAVYICNHLNYSYFDDTPVTQMSLDAEPSEVSRAFVETPRPIAINKEEEDPFAKETGPADLPP